ncbi:unnamed protein product, partial [Mesorhabditis spiculigera]
MITAPSTSLLRIGAAGQLLNVRGMGRRQPKQGKPPILPPSKKVLYHVVNPEWEKPEHVKELLWRRFAYNNGVNSLRILFKQEASSKISTGQGLASMREEEEKEFNILIAANEERNLKKSKEREIRSLEKWNTTRQEMMDEISSTLTEQEKQAKWAEERVREAIRDSKDYVNKENLEEKIKAALESPKIYDFAIDKTGGKLENPAPVKYQEGTPTIQKGRLRRMVKQINIKYRPLDYVWLGVDRAILTCANFFAKLVGKSTFQFLIDTGLINASSLRRLRECIEAAKDGDKTGEELERELHLEDDSSKYVLHYLTTADEKYEAVLAEIERLASMKVERDDPEMRADLDELWKLPAEYTFDPPGDWTLIGFQRSNDPTTDFRSTGSLGLAQMLFFVKYHRIVLDHEVAWPEALPFALTSIHITAFLMALMKEQVLRDHFYAGNELPSLEGFNKIHCRLLWLMSVYWGKQGAESIMQFEHHFKAFQNGVVRLLHFRQKSLHEITVEEIVSA